MIYKSKSYTYNWEDISFEINWTLRTRVKDPSQFNWFRDSKILFKDWYEIKWEDKLSLPKLYFDVFPELTITINKKILLRKSRLEEMFPLTALQFELPIECIYIEPETPQPQENIPLPIKTNTPKSLLPIKTPKTPPIQKKTPTPTIQKKTNPKEIEIKITPSFLIELKKELKEEILKELRQEISTTTPTPTEYTPWESDTILQKNKKWKVIWSFLNASEAARTVWLSQSSMSQALKWTTATAWWFIWSIIKSNPLIIK